MYTANARKRRKFSISGNCSRYRHIFQGILQWTFLKYFFTQSRFVSHRLQVQLIVRTVNLRLNVAPENPVLLDQRASQLVHYDHFIYLNFKLKNSLLLQERPNLFEAIWNALWQLKYQIQIAQFLASQKKNIK